MLWNAKNGEVQLWDDVMSYAKFGSGEKHFIILPGLSDGLATVRGKALLLAPPYKKFFDKYTVWMFSRRDGLQKGCSIREMADDQARAMRSLGIGRACVMGVSQGGMIAQLLAANHPELVEKLVLAVTAPDAVPVAVERLNDWIGFAAKGDHKSLMIDTAENSYSEDYLKKYRKMYPVIGSIGKPKNYSRFLANAEAILGFDASAELPRISCPTLIIGGSDDRIVGAEASQKLHDLIPGSELYIYDGLGHAAYEEAPDFNDRVLRFLEA